MNPSNVSWIVLAWVVAAGSVAGLLALFARMWFGAHEHGENAGSDTSLGFSLTRYQVMERLLSSREVQFLSAQPDFTAKMASKWKRDSLRIFRLYLVELTRDFHALHALARRMVVESRSESPELASILLRQQAAFWRARIALEGRLVLFALGSGSVDVAPLLQMIEAMRMDLGRFIPDPIQSA